MTVESTNSFSGPFACNGVTLLFNYDYLIFDEDQLFVTHISADGLSSTPLVLNVDYVVDGVGEQGGGIITTMGAYTDGTITIERVTSLKQLLYLQNQGAFFAADIMRALDRIVMMVQEIYTTAVNMSLTIVNGVYDATSHRITGVLAGQLPSDAVNKAQLDGASIAAGNVPVPGGGNVGKYLQALTSTTWGWVAGAASVTAAQISDASANGRSLITAANYAAMKVLLGITTAGTTAMASTVEYITGSATRVVELAQMWAAGATQTISYAAAVTPDFNTFLHGQITLLGALTLNNPTGMKPGQCGSIRLIQDATGGRVITWGTNYLFPGGDNPLLSTAAAAEDVLFYQVRSATTLYCSLNKAFS